MTQRLREAQPALVVIAVGGAGDQSGLISLLSAGLVDRLMLKPVTPALAQIVLKSAVQQHRTLQGAEHRRDRARAAVSAARARSRAGRAAAPCAANDLTEVKLDPQPSPAEVVVPASMVAPAATSQRIDIPRPPWFAVVAALLAVAGLMYWVAAARNPAIDPQAVIANNLVAAQRAFNEGHALEPRGRSALDHYTTVLALDPTNAAARQGIDQIADRFAAQAGVAIARGQVAAAIVALDSVRRVRPEHRQLRELQARLDAAQATYAAKVSEPVEATPKAAPKKATPAPSTTPAQQKIEAQARAVAEAAAALKRDQLKLANAQQQFALKIEAAQAQLAAARKESAEPPAPASAALRAQLTGAREPASRPHREARVSAGRSAQRSGRLGQRQHVGHAGGQRAGPASGRNQQRNAFNRAAMRAVRKWKYEPFAAADPQEKRRVTVRVDFRMKKSYAARDGTSRFC